MHIFIYRIKILMAILAIYSYTTHAQIITENFNYTGAPVIWTVPSCVDSISITIAGAEGGGSDPDRVQH